MFRVIGRVITTALMCPEIGALRHIGHIVYMFSKISAHYQYYPIPFTERNFLEETFKIIFIHIQNHLNNEKLIFEKVL